MLIKREKYLLLIESFHLILTFHLLTLWDEKQILIFYSHFFFIRGRQKSFYLAKLKVGFTCGKENNKKSTFQQPSRALLNDRTLRDKHLCFCVIQQMCYHLATKITCLMKHFSPFQSAKMFLILIKNILQQICVISNVL